jgi:Concanavalin A-like lectin/glucanases superfamily
MSVISTRPFAYNVGGPIDGTTQLADLAIGSTPQEWSLNHGGVPWWEGPDENLGYVITVPVSGNDQPTPIPGVTASVGFYRSEDFTDSSFINIAEFVSREYGFPQTFSSATQASIWLTNTGFWNSYVLPVLYLDAGNPASYPGTGNTWTDIVGGKTFNLINGVTYNSGNGGKLNFNAASGQYANCSTSLPSLTQWTVSAWHYYTGQNTGTSPCIVSEVFTGGYINYILGNGSDTSPDLQTGFWAPGWKLTNNGYTLTPNNWYYIVGTYDSNTLRLYVNNVLVESTSGLEFIPQSSNSGIYLMSRWDNTPTELWGGYLSTVGIYDNYMSPGQINHIWNSEKSRYGL